MSLLLRMDCFRYGQLSGLVEPIAGVLGALLVSVVVPILPYSLAFAAGAMVYVVVDDIIPEAQSRYAKELIQILMPHFDLLFITNTSK